MMTTRERWLAAIKMQPVDRLPFWPKILGGYLPAQREPFSSMSIDEIHDWIGSDKHIPIGSCVREIRKKSSRKISIDNGVKKVVYTAPAGELTAVLHFDKPSQSWHPVKFPIETAEDIKVMTDWYNDATLDIDNDGLEEMKMRQKEAGDNASTRAVIGESPLMDFIEWLAGVENGHYLLIDYQDEVEELFSVMHSYLIRKTEIMAEYSPADMLYFIENTSTTLISPEQFRKYCFNHLRDYARIINEANKPFVMHMCGHLKDILADISRIDAAAIEAFTTPTLGNTELIDGRTTCPDKCIIGGTNALLWTQDAEAIIEKIQQDLDTMPHHRGLVISSAGVMPPMAEPETIKKVADWLKTYKVCV